MVTLKHLFIVGFFVFSLQAWGQAQSPTTAAPAMCANNLDCGEQGHCVSGECLCNDGYLTVDEGEPCAYEQKEQETAFGLSFIGFLGADRFYVGSDGYGAAKLSLTLLGASCTPCGAICVVCRYSFCSDLCTCFPKPVHRALAWIYFATGIGAAASAFAWWITDIFLFGFNENKDGNGQPLKKM